MKTTAEGDSMRNDQLISMVEKQILKFEELSKPNKTEAQIKNDRPTIILQPGEIHIATSLAEEALLNSEFNLFQRSGNHSEDLKNGVIGFAQHWFGLGWKIPAKAVKISKKLIQ